MPGRLHVGLRILLISLQDRKYGWIQVIPKIEANGTNRSLVTNTRPQCLRNVIEVAGPAPYRALAGVLVKPSDALGHIVGGREHVAGIVKEHKAQVIFHEGQVHRWGPHFQVVDEERLPAEWSAGGGVARPGLIDGKTSQGITAAGQEPLGKRNHLVTAEQIFYADAGGACEHPLVLRRRRAEGHIRGVLHQRGAIAAMVL